MSSKRRRRNRGFRTRFLESPGVVREATPEDERYLERLRKMSEEAIEAEEQFELDELEEYARRLRERGSLPERNPFPLIPVIGVLLAAGATVGVGAWVRSLVQQQQAETERQIAEAQQQQQEQSRAQQIQWQMWLDQVTPIGWIAVPLIAGAGAFLLWKSRKKEA